MDKHKRIIVSRSMTASIAPILLILNVYRFGLCVELISGIMASCVLFVIAQTDYYTFRVPNVLSLLLCFVGLIHSLAVGRGAVDILLGFSSVSFLLFLLALIKPGAIGGGDIKLMAAAGVLLGFCGILQASIIGSVLAGMVALSGFALSHYNRTTRIAMAPYYVLGILTVLFLQ